MIVAKFSCLKVEKVNEDQEDVYFHPVTDDGSEENKSFWEATPAGSIEMSITNKAAHGRFERGKDYLVHFTPVED